MNGWAFTPTISNRIHKVIVLPPDESTSQPAASGITCRVLFAVPVGRDDPWELTLNLTITPTGETWSGTYEGDGQPAESDNPLARKVVAGDLAPLDDPAPTDARTTAAPTPARCRRSSRT